MNSFFKCGLLFALALIVSCSDGNNDFGNPLPGQGETQNRPQPLNLKESILILFSAQITPAVYNQFDTEALNGFLVSQNCAQVIEVEGNQQVIRFAGRACGIPNSTPTMIRVSERKFDLYFRSGTIVNETGIVVGAYHYESLPNGTTMKIDALCTGAYTDVCTIEIDSSGHFAGFQW